MVYFPDLLTEHVIRYPARKQLIESDLQVIHLIYILKRFCNHIPHVIRTARKLARIDFHVDPADDFRGKPDLDRDRCPILCHAG